MFRISIISKDTKFTLKSLDPAKVKILQHNYSRAPARIENITANIASVRDNGQATGTPESKTRAQGPGSAPSAATSRWWRLIVCPTRASPAAGRGPLAAPCGWTSTSSRSAEADGIAAAPALAPAIKPLGTEPPQPGASAGGNRSPKGPARQGAGPPGSSYSPPHHDAGSTEL